MLVLGSGLAGDSKPFEEFLVHGTFFALLSFKRFQMVGKRKQLSCAYLQSLSYYDGYDECAVR